MRNDRLTLGSNHDLVFAGLEHFLRSLAQSWHWLRRFAACVGVHAVHTFMTCFEVSLVARLDDSETMEKEVTPQKDAPPAQGGKRLDWRASAVDASVCGVGGNHLGRRFGWLDAKQLINGGWLCSELPACGDLDLELSLRRRELVPICDRWLADAESFGHRRLGAVVLKDF